MKNSMEVPQKIKNRTTIWSSNFTFGYLSKGNENTKKKEQIDILDLIKMNNLWYIHPYSGILLSHDKKWTGVSLNNLHES